MKIYVGKNKLRAKQTTLYDLIMDSLKDNDFDTELSGAWTDENHSWIEINQTNEKRKAQISIVMGFDIEKDTIIDINVYKSEIKTIIDTENMVKLT